MFAAPSETYELTLTHRTRRGLRRFVGAHHGLNTAIDLGLFTALIAFSGVTADRANGVSYGCRLITDFILSRGWQSHDVRGDTAEQLTRVIVLGLAALLLSTMVVTGLSTVMPALAAKLVSLPVMFVWNRRAIALNRAPAMSHPFAL